MFAYTAESIFQYWSNAPIGGNVKFRFFTVEVELRIHALFGQHGSPRNNLSSAWRDGKMVEYTTIYGNSCIQ